MASEVSPEVAIRAYPKNPVLLFGVQAAENIAAPNARQSRLVIVKKSQAFENKVLVEHCGRVYTYVTLGVNPQ